VIRLAYAMVTNKTADIRTQRFAFYRRIRETYGPRTIFIHISLRGHFILTNTTEHQAGAVLKLHRAPYYVSNIDLIVRVFLPPV